MNFRKSMFITNCQHEGSIFLEGVVDILLTKLNIVVTTCFHHY